MLKQAGEAKLMSASVFHSGSYLSKPGFVGMLITCIITAQPSRHTSTGTSPLVHAAGSGLHMRVQSRQIAVYIQNITCNFSTQTKLQGAKVLVVTHPDIHSG